MSPPGSKIPGHFHIAVHSLRNLYSGVMLDVAWALFEIRMLHRPVRTRTRYGPTSPAIISRRPASEYSLVAVRVQLMDSPATW